jgi:hypothetical protein
MTDEQWFQILNDLNPVMRPLYEVLEAEIKHSFQAGKLDACQQLARVRTGKQYRQRIETLRRKIRYGRLELTPPSGMKVILKELEPNISIRRNGGGNNK